MIYLIEIFNSSYNIDYRLSLLSKVITYTYYNIYLFIICHVYCYTFMMLEIYRHDYISGDVINVIKLTQCKSSNIAMFLPSILYSMVAKNCYRMGKWVLIIHRLIVAPSKFNNDHTKHNNITIFSHKFSA